MSQKINFCRLANPKSNVETCYHPLSGEQVRINSNRAKRMKQGQAGQGDQLMQEIIANAAKTSPFNRERIFDKVPKFDASICPEGRFILGDAVLFPNLNPFGENHAVVVLCIQDYLDMTQFAPKMLKDALMVSKQYFQAIHTVSPTENYPLLMWNYMPPSAGSIIHPHFQVFTESAPIPALAHILQNAKNYVQRNGSNFFIDLIDTEKALKERFITQTDHVVVLATFAPRGLFEVTFLVPGVSSFMDLNEKQMEDFASILSRVVAAYHLAMGVCSFNLASYSAPKGQCTDHFTLHFRLFARPDPKGVYTNDTGPMERVYDSWVIDSLPEVVAQALRQALDSSTATTAPSS